MFTVKQSKSGVTFYLSFKTLRNKNIKYSSNKLFQTSDPKGTKVINTRNP